MTSSKRNEIDINATISLDINIIHAFKSCNTPFGTRLPMSLNNTSPELVLDVLQQFRLIYGSMRRHFKLVEERCGMSGSQMWILQEVQRSPEIGISDLAARMGIHQSTCSLLVDRLVTQGGLTKRRRESDQRRVGLYLTEVALKALAALPGPAEGILPEALSMMPGVTLNTLHHNLDTLIQHLPGCDRNFASMPLADLVKSSNEVD